MFELFSAQDLVRVSRHTMVTGIIVGIVGLVGAIVLNAPWVGLGICLGVGIGIVNFRLIVKSVARVGERESLEAPPPVGGEHLDAASA